MKAQKSWDTPVADETRDVSDASEDIHGITDDITDDAESAEVDAEAVTLLRKRHRRMTLLVVVVIVASLVSGFCWRRSLQTGSPVNCSHQTGVADEKDYCYGGFKPLQPSGPQLGRSQAGPYFAKAVKGTAAAYDAVRLAAVGGDPGGIVTAITGVVCPQDAKYALDGDAPFVNTSDTSEHPAKGARLSEKDAGQYYLEAVKPSIQPLRDAMNTLYGGDLKATRAAAGKAATVLRATAKALRSRTWPDEVANAAAVVANEYDAKARQASYVADSVTPSASDELISLDAYGVSEADVYLRGKLGLPAAEAPSAPLEITGIEDRGIQQGADAGGSTVDTGKRIIAVTVRSHVPGTLSGLNLTFDLKKGKTTLGRISGIMDDIALAEGQSIVVPVPVDIGGDDGGIAGATMSWDSWSLTDWRGESHIAAASDDFAEYAPDKVMGTFTLR